MKHMMCKSNALLNNKHDLSELHFCSGFTQEVSSSSDSEGLGEDGELRWGGVEKRGR